MVSEDIAGAPWGRAESEERAIESEQSGTLAQARVPAPLALLRTSVDVRKAAPDQTSRIRHRRNTAVR
jgi:hypothetical protein